MNPPRIVRLPKEKPAPGMVKIGFGYKTEDGARVEFSGELPKEFIEEVMQMIIETSVSHRRNPQ